MVTYSHFVVGTYAARGSQPYGVKPHNSSDNRPAAVAPTSMSYVRVSSAPHFVCRQPALWPAAVQPWLWLGSPGYGYGGLLGTSLRYLAVTGNQCKVLGGYWEPM